jgi:hypothetical protein
MNQTIRRRSRVSIAVLAAATLLITSRCPILADGRHGAPPAAADRTGTMHGKPGNRGDTPRETPSRHARTRAGDRSTVAIRSAK